MVCILGFAERRDKINRMIQRILLFCALSVKCSQSCVLDRDCNYMQCQFGGYCVLYPPNTHHYYKGQCYCAACKQAGDCPLCGHHHAQGPHRYCSEHDRHCHCVDCVVDNHCHCHAGQIGKCITDNQTRHDCICQATTTTTTTTTTTSTTPITTTTTTTTTTQQPLVKLECHHRKISVIESIAENLHVEDSRAELCPGTTKHQTSEAFVINKCNSTARSSWSKGEQVRTECLDNVSQYIPISTFSDQGNDMAAFLIDCTKTDDNVISGLTIAVQTCHDAPMVMKLNDTTTPRISDFYTILQRK
ncbi:uncharacterized protein [Magallana gigas]|uniref:uncharacterized protein n=1 Tax=Magallana gigas TaxID=29159 RepID=UPI0033404D04